MRRTATVCAVLVGGLLLAGIGVAATSSYNSNATELSSAVELTNFVVSGSGDDASADFSDPDMDITTDSEFNNGTLENLSVQGSGESASLFGDLLIVSSIITSDTDFNNADMLTNLSVTGSGNAAFVELGSSSSTTFHDIFSDEGDDTFDSGTFFVGDTNNDLAMKHELNFTASSSGTLDRLDVNITGTEGADYGFNVDVYIVEGEGVDNTFEEGTKIATWDPDFSTGIQSIPVDQTSISSGTEYTLEFVSSSTDSDGTIDLIRLGGDTSPTEPHTSTNRDGLLDRYGDVQIVEETLVSSGQYKGQNHTVESAKQAAVNVSLDNASFDVRVEYWDGSEWQIANDTNLTSSGNHSLDISGHESRTKWQLNGTMKNLDGSTTAEFHDESLLTSRQGNFTSSSRSVSPDGGYVDLSTSGTNATVRWQGQNDSDSSWSTITTQDISSTGNHSTSFGDTYDQYRVDFTGAYDAGDTGEITVNEFGWTGSTSGTYVGQNLSVDNVTHGFISANVSNANLTVTWQGYDSSTDQWDDLGNETFTDSVFDSFELSDGASDYDTQRTRITADPTGSSPTAVINAEGFSGGDTVQEITTVVNGTNLLAALTTSPQSLTDTEGILATFSVIRSQVDASIDRRWFNLKLRLGLVEDTKSITQRATELREFYNDRSDSFTSYLNSQTADETVNLSEWDTVRIELTAVSGNATETIYWLCLVDGQECATTTVVENTSRTVDKSVFVEGYATINALHEVEQFHQEFVLEQQATDTGYRAGLSAKYGPDLSGSALNASA